MQTNHSCPTSRTEGENRIVVIFRTRFISLKEGVVSKEEVKMVNSSAKKSDPETKPGHCHSEKLVYLNYCVSGVLSRCGAGPNPQEQKKCRYYQKSTIRDRCMHYIETLDGHCDSVDAQREVNRPQDDKDN